MRIKCSNSYQTALRKADTLLETSAISDDSEEAEIAEEPSRKRKRPQRLLSFEMESTEETDMSPSLLPPPKKYHVPSFPRKEKNTISDSPSFWEQNKSTTLPRMERRISYETTNLQPNNTNQNVLSQHLIVQINELRAEVSLMQKKLDTLLEGKAPTDAAVSVLPTEIELPLGSEQDLEALNYKLQSDKALSPIMVKFLYDAGYGKTASSFIQSVTKKVLAQDLAMQYSRCGRKGKKSFLPFSNISNVILAATARRFEGIPKHSLMESFGKALANAPEWYGRKETKKDMEEGSSDND